MNGTIGVGGVLIVLGLLATMESVLDKDLAGRPVKVLGRVLIGIGAILVVAGLVEWLL